MTEKPKVDIPTCHTENCEASAIDQCDAFCAEHHPDRDPLRCSACGTVTGDLLTVADANAQAHFCSISCMEDLVARWRS